MKNKFSERLRDLRLEKELSQNQLAKNLGLTHTAINLWESNKRVPNLEALIIIAQYFNVTIDYLAGLED